jgi:hypothetical protein
MKTMDREATTLPEAPALKTVETAYDAFKRRRNALVERLRSGLVKKVTGSLRKGKWNACFVGAADDLLKE